MRSDSKIDYTLSPANGKRFGTDSYMFEPHNAGDWGKTKLQSIQFLRTDLGGGHASTEVAIGIEGNNPRDMAHMRVLLEAGGFDPEKMDVSDHGSESYVTIKGASADDMIRVVAALASDQPNANGVDFYKMLPVDIANGIADIAAQNMNISPLVAVRSIEMDVDRAAAFGVDDAPTRYMDVDMQQFPVSPVRYIRDDSRWAERENGEKTMERHCALSVDPAKIPQLKSAFTRTGLAHEITGAAQMSVEASSRAVLDALDTEGLIPHHFANALD